MTQIISIVPIACICVAILALLVTFIVWDSALRKKRNAGKKGKEEEKEIISVSPRFYEKRNVITSGNLSVVIIDNFVTPKECEMALSVASSAFLRVWSFRTSVEMDFRRQLEKCWLKRAAATIETGTTGKDLSKIAQWTRVYNLLQIQPSKNGNCCMLVFCDSIVEKVKIIPAGIEIPCVPGRCVWFYWDNANAQKVCVVPHNKLEHSSPGIVGVLAK
jgi:hypothetical protein